MKPEFDDLRTLDLPNNSTDQIRSFPDLPGGSDLTRTFSKLSSEEVRSPSSCSDLSSVSTIKRADDSVNYDSVIRYIDGGNFTNDKYSQTCEPVYNIHP